MKIYKVDTKKSKIQLSSNVGDLQFKGAIDAHDGKLISELGELIEGNIGVDLRSLSIVDSSLDKADEEKILQVLRSSSIFDGEDSIANYKIDKVIADECSHTIKGLLTLGNHAYGMDVDTIIEQSDGDLHASGKIRVSRSNPLFLEELVEVLQTKKDWEKPINTLEIDCDIYASSNC